MYSSRGKNVVFGVLALFFLFSLLTGCEQVGAAPGSETARFSLAVQEGIIVAPEVIAAGDIGFRTVPAEIGAIRRELQVPINVYFPIEREFRFERDGGRLFERNVAMNNFVDEGDVLLSIIFDEEALRVEEEQLRIRMAEAQRRHDSDRARRRADIENFRNEIHADMREADLEIHALRLEGMEADYLHFIDNFERSRLDQLEQLEDIQERIEGEAIIAPFSGMVSQVNTMRLNHPVETWQVMVTLRDVSVFQLHLTGPRENLRYGDTVWVTDRNGDLHRTTVVSDPLAHNVRAEIHRYVLQPVDPDLTAASFIWGDSSAFAHPVSVYIENVVLLPTRAVHHEETRRYVLLYEDSIIRKRYVQTGLIHNEVIQVLDGIEPGQLVVLP